MSQKKEIIPDLPIESSDTSDFPAPDDYPSWLILQQGLEKTPPTIEEST